MSRWGDAQGGDADPCEFAKLTNRLGSGRAVPSEVGSMRGILAATIIISVQKENVSCTREDALLLLLAVHVQERRTA